MTRVEAAYWLEILRRTLCGVMQDNIKDVMLRGKDFDRRAVTHLKLYGCLPIQERKSGGEEGGNYYNERHTRGEIRFESCMSVIR